MADISDSSREHSPQNPSPDDPVLIASPDTLPEGHIRDNLLEWTNVEKGLAVIGRNDFLDFVAEDPHLKDKLFEITGDNFVK